MTLVYIIFVLREGDGRREFDTCLYYFFLGLQHLRCRTGSRASARIRCQTGQYWYQNDPEKSEGGDSGEVRRVGGGPEGRSILTLLLRQCKNVIYANPDPGSGAFLTPGSGIRDPE